MEKVLFSWSGGKDSALALYQILKNQDYQIAALLTTVTEEYDRISMHGVRRTLLEQQADVLGFPLEKVRIPKNASNEAYELAMGQMLEKYKAEGVNSVVFGDIFLEDIRNYREEKLAGQGLNGIFPLWEKDTCELSQTFLTLGFKAVITCVDTQQLDGSFAGRMLDAQFLADLPASVDPCGENGEFHSFVYDGPIFGASIPCKTGEIILRDNRFCFCDLLPEEG